MSLIVGGGAFSGAPSSILVSNTNAENTAVGGDPSSFVLAKLSNNLAPPVVGYDGLFSGVADQSASISYKGEADKDYRIDFSGSVSASDPAFLGTYIGIKVTSSTGQVFTGGTKAYPVGVVLGGPAPAVGFSVDVYGKFGKDEVLSVELSSNNAGNLVLSDLIVFAVEIKPVG